MLFRSVSQSRYYTRDLIFTNKNVPIYPPFTNCYYSGSSYTKVTNAYVDIVPTLVLDPMEYSFASSGSNSRVCFVSRNLYCEPGTYRGSDLQYTLVVPPTKVVLFTNVTLTVTRLPNGCYNYLIQSSDISTPITPGDLIDFTKQINFVAYPTTMAPIDYQNEKLAMRDVLISDRGFSDPASTHVALISTSNRDEIAAQIQIGNYSNLIVASQDQMAASFADRAITTSELVSDDSGIGRIDFITLLMLVKTGVDVVAKASKILSDVLTYVIPIFQANGSYISESQLVVFDLTGTEPTYFEVDKTRNDITSYPDITNPQIDVVTLV